MPSSFPTDLEWYDASKLKEFQLCPQRYAYRYELFLQPAGRIYPELSFGSALHASLEDFYLGRAWDLVPCPHLEGDPAAWPEATCEICQSKNGQIRRFTASFLKHFPRSHETYANNQFKYNHRTQLVGLQLLLGYFRDHQKEPFEVIGVEQRFCIRLPGDPPFYYVGKIDLATRATDGDRPLDHKSAGRFGEAFEGQFRLDLQITGYIFALLHLAEDKTTVVREGYINAFLVNKAIGENSFLRKITTRSAEDLERWQADVAWYVTQIRRCRETGHWPLNDHNCFAYNKPCPYRELCTMRAVGRPRAIEDLYSVEQWDPFR